MDDEKDACSTTDRLLCAANGTADLAGSLRRDGAGEPENGQGGSSAAQSLPELPAEVWAQVCHHVDPRTVLICVQMCRVWRAAIESDGGTIYRDALRGEKQLPRKVRLACPKKPFEKLEREYAEAVHDETRLVHYRNFARVCVMRTCPQCKCARHMCVVCGKTVCRKCKRGEILPDGLAVTKKNFLFILSHKSCALYNYLQTRFSKTLKSARVEYWPLYIYGELNVIWPLLNHFTSFYFPTPFTYPSWR